MEGTCCSLHAFSAHCGKGKERDLITQVLRALISSPWGGGGLKSCESKVYFMDYKFCWNIYPIFVTSQDVLYDARNAVAAVLQLGV